MIHKRKIYGFMCDIYGHLNNANYLYLYEEARAEGLEEIGIPIRLLNQREISIYLTEINLKFLKSVMLEDTVKIKSKIIKYNKLKSVWEQKMYNSNNELCNIATVTGVFVKNGKPFRIPNDIYDIIKNFVTKDNEL